MYVTYIHVRVSIVCLSIFMYNRERTVGKLCDCPLTFSYGLEKKFTNGGLFVLDKVCGLFSPSFVI